MKRHQAGRRRLNLVQRLASPGREAMRRRIARIHRVGPRTVLRAPIARLAERMPRGNQGPSRGSC
jgi:hypothetical protein